MKSTNTKSTHYDYIIAGSGCAGLSLLYRILHEPSLENKSILVLDKTVKNSNDRTWCFWEKEAGLFEPIVAHHWNTLQFKSPAFESTFDLKSYSYKMIKGIDFYQYVLAAAKGKSNVTFVQEQIKSISENNKNAEVETETNRFTADYVFNSTPLFHPKMDKQNSLLQHFQGWFIKTNQNVFDSKVGTLMDFELEQKDGATFMYVLPTSPNEALIEYTLFSPEVLERDHYTEALNTYIKEVLKIESFEITHEEYGVIPMSLAKFSRTAHSNNHIINIGTAGGFTKASSGYTFQFIQRHTAQIIDQLTQNKRPKVEPTLRDKSFEWYDRTMLEVLLSKKMEGRELFETMFKSIPPEKILAFLANESSVADDLKIMACFPMLTFTPAAIKQLF